MDIFIIENTVIDNIPEELLLKYQKHKITNEKKLKMHCLAYLMLDRILKEVYKIEERTIYFQNNKPILQSGEKFFSISHSGKYVVLAFSDYNCGIDIEEIKERNYKQISERMNFKSDNLENFYGDWTRYEAEYKLGETSKKEYRLKFENYYITACSENQNEEFQIYIQNEKSFSN